MMLAVFNQLSGLNALNFYSSVIFASVFPDNPNAVTVGTSLTGVAQILGVLICPIIGQRLPLKTILVWGTAA